MRKAQYQKIEVLERQVAALLPQNKIETLGSILQILDELKRANFIENWEPHNIDDVYFFQQLQVYIGGIDKWMKKKSILNSNSNTNKT